ncbi:MAG: fasciclin domain-containing protein, partial [Duncaniella sp.]|nr:fasciclin domain-containing protein [Duncaniella sp.]
MKTLNIIPAFLVAALSLTSCSDDWDNHYDRSETAATESVLDMVKGNPDLSTFARMIEIAGYSDLLGSSQTFTVFAPTNEALAGVNLENTDEVKRIVANHIARFNNSTASDAAQGVKMYNGKRFFFDGNNFGGATLDDTDNIATNGILHIVSTQIPYVYNLREYFDTHDNTSAIAEFIARFDEKQLDLEASVAIGVDEKGQTVYDSVL